jgi:hypothetical protein
MECPICFDTLHANKFTFNCKHSICKKCFRNMSKKGQTIVHDISMVNIPFIHSFELKQIKCPLCRQNIFNNSQSAYLNALNECFPGYVK